MVGLLALHPWRLPWSLVTPTSAAPTPRASQDRPCCSCHGPRPCLVRNTNSKRSLHSYSSSDVLHAEVVASGAWLHSHPSCMRQCNPHVSSGQLQAYFGFSGGTLRWPCLRTWLLRLKMLRVVLRHRHAMACACCPGDWWFASTLQLLSESLHRWSRELL